MKASAETSRTPGMLKFGKAVVKGGTTDQPWTDRPAEDAPSVGADHLTGNRPAIGLGAGARAPRGTPGEGVVQFARRSRVDNHTNVDCIQLELTGNHIPGSNILTTPTSSCMVISFPTPAAVLIRLAAIVFLHAAYSAWKGESQSLPID